MKLKSAIHKLSTARAEFHSTSNSVYGRFVVPPFIDTIDLFEIDHSMAIVGGRGCGKTTYVRYFSHWTQFDTDNPAVDHESLKCLVLYWKPDTTYYRSLSQSWLTERNSRIFFNVLSGLFLLKELFSAIRNIQNHFPELVDQLSQNSLFWNRVEKITGPTPNDVESTINWIDDSLFDVQVSINSNETDALPRIEPKALLDILLPALTKGCELLSNTRFKIFVDEFENLAVYQQKIINGYRKHSDAFLSWNVAHKRFAIVSNATDGDEKIQHGDDYREYIIDKSYQSFEEEKFFLCELLALGLLEVNLTCEVGLINPSVLGDRRKIALRKDSSYRASVTNIVKRIIPNISNRDLAREAIKIPAVRNITQQTLLKITGLGEKMVGSIIEDHPDVAIATIAISSQRSFKVKDLASYIKEELPSKHPYAQRVQTYLPTALLALNARYSYINIPIYSGFDRFCQLSFLNIRHFFDLCYSSFKLMDADTEINSLEEFPSVPLELMHQGAINSSNNIIREVQTYTPMGLTLSGLVNRLGDIFQIWQKGDNQSEPERTHFFILNDFGSLPEKIKEVIDQAKCWRVLIEYPATKDKNSNSSSGYEYRLNPIYSPYFNISYRKIRRIELSEADFFGICFGDNSVYEGIRAKQIALSKSSSDSKVNIEQGSLF